MFDYVKVCVHAWIQHPHHDFTVDSWKTLLNIDTIESLSIHCMHSFCSLNSGWSACFSGYNHRLPLVLHLCMWKLADWFLPWPPSIVLCSFAMILSLFLFWYSRKDESHKKGLFLCLISHQNYKKNQERVFPLRKSLIMIFTLWDIYVTIKALAITTITNSYIGEKNS